MVIARGTARRVGTVLGQDPGQQGQGCANLIIKCFPLSFAQTTSSGGKVKV